MKNPESSHPPRPSDDWRIEKDTTTALLAYCRARNWAGYDPYDALNSGVFRALPFLDFKLARLMLTQGVKRSPVNLRPLLGVPKTPNPKGIALFLSSLIKLSKIGVPEAPEEIGGLARTLLDMRSPGQERFCWGYNFDWQTLGKLVPKASPNIICTTFAANALLDGFERYRDSSWLEAAVSAAEFILDALFWRKSRSEAYFFYTPGERTVVHNANLLGAALLCRVGRASGRTKFLEPALEAARASVGKQHADGSWAYGESHHQRWIDNFHTGFDLIALRRIGEEARTTEFEAALVRGFDFYRTHFFREDGAPRYYHDATYPIDAHSVAQSILTLAELDGTVDGNGVSARAVFRWARTFLWDRRGFFYYQKLPFHTVRVSFMRWTQAWMLWALAALLEHGPHD